MDKRDFCIRFGIWTAVITAAVVAIVGLFFGKIIEDTLFAEITKWCAMGIVVIGILEGFAYFLAPIIWHFFIERKKNNN